MRIYRCITLQEVFNKYKNIPNKQGYNPLKNTHNYDQNKRYIHFFKYYEFAKKYFNEFKDGKYDIPKSEFVLFMTANIPYEILEKYKGYGLYQVDNCKNLLPIIEYAIPEEIFNPDYIVDLTNKPLDGYLKKGENEEYLKYLEYIKNLKDGYDDKTLLEYLSQNDLEDILNVEIDDRKESEYYDEAKKILEKFDFTKFNDDEIEEYDRRII